MNEHGKISYVEFPATDLTATKQFFQSVFGWSLGDWAVVEDTLQQEEKQDCQYTAGR
jgi:predicted enzyme related to lactoylglutathione lyase